MLHFSFQCVDDPCCGPEVILFEIVQDLYYLISLSRIAYERSPDEDGMADGNRQWNSLR
jgi:hypothetical protein